MMPKTANTTAPAIDASSILRFWFEEVDPIQWWRVDPGFDALVRDRFGALLSSAAACELWAWRATALGRLAEVIVLDQFSRNIHRGTPLAFAADPQALVLAQEAVACGADQALPVAQRRFLYMPYMHSESLRVHDEAMALFGVPGMDDALEFERRHRAVIERFGRYPHRNAILGRMSSDEETEFLKGPGSSF